MELAKAIRERPDQVMRILIRSPLLIHEKVDGTTILHLAVQHNTDIIPTLIEMGVDLDAVNEGGYTALHLAICFHREECARTLIEHGANLEIKTETMQTALHLALKDHPSIVRYLIEKDANIQAADVDGDKPIHVACHSNPMCIWILVEAGADVNEQNYEDVTPLHLTSLQFPSMIPYLVEKGADIHAVDSTGNTVLHYTIRGMSEGCASVVAYYLDRGMDINEQNCEGKTALHEACSYERKDVIQLLLERGADSTIKDGHGNTPYTRTKKYKYLFKKRRRDETFTAMELGPCTVCLERLRTCIFIPCGHYISCSQCSEGMTTCPICRETIQETHGVFI
jgi:ankyrin repeat protein